MMISYLLELRRRSLYILVVYLGLFSFFFYFANTLFLAFIHPLLPTQNLVATQVTAPLLTPLKLAASAAFLCSAPFALLQFWFFIRPALYAFEQKTFKQALFLSLSLFTLGILFCYGLILPFLFQFLQSTLPKGVRYLPDISSTLDFIIHMLLIFGFCFQLPLVCYLLVRLGLCELGTLKVIRPYVIVGAFIIGMLLTPPDVLSQVLLAVPLCLLYELGLILCWMQQKNKKCNSTASYSQEIKK